MGSQFCWFQVNSKCDGDLDGYDAMVLLTGRYDFGDIMSEGLTPDDEGLDQRCPDIEFDC